MPNGFFTKPDDIQGAIVEFLCERKLGATVLTQYDTHPIYIQKAQCLIFIEGEYASIHHITDELHGETEQPKVAAIELSIPDSLEQIEARLRDVINGTIRPMV